MPAASPRVVVAFIAALVFGACRVDAVVSINVEGRGGSVSARFVLDSEAVSVLGVEGAGALQAGDLRAAGWEITGPKEREDGSVVAEATKRFGDPAGFSRVMRELSGDAGPLKTFRMRRDRSLTSIGYRLSGLVDLETPGAATGVGNTAGLPERLRDAGVDPEALATLLAGRAAEGLRLDVVVDLPGGGQTIRVNARPGETVEVRAASSVTERTRPALLAVSATLALATLSLVAAGRRRRPQGASPG